MNSFPEPNWLYARAINTPNRIAIVYKAHEYTYYELHTSASKIAYILRSMYPDTERVAINMQNNFLYISLIHALIYLDWQLVLINTRLSPEEVSYQLDVVDVDLVISDNKMLIQSVSFNGQVLFDDDLNRAISETEVSFDEIKPIDPRKIFTFVFTSGTTGTPKIVPLTYGNHYWSAIGSAWRLGVLPDDSWLLTIPLYHLGGLSIVFRSCIYGIRINLQEGFDIDAVLLAIRSGVTHISLVPTMLKRLIPVLEGVDHALRVVLIGGAALSPQLTKSALDLQLPIFASYGLTECASQFVTANPELLRNKPTTVGKPLVYNQIKLFDRDEHGVGEIGIKGPTVTSGYFSDDEVNNDVFRNGYFLTGDIGYIDEDGDLFVYQRRKDLIISGGENIYPSEIEDCLQELPVVDDAVVLGIEDADWGQIPVGVLKLQNPITTDEIISFLRDKLGSYKIPRKYYLVQEFPRTSSGKIKREKLLELLLHDGIELIP